MVPPLRRGDMDSGFRGNDGQAVAPRWSPRCGGGTWIAAYAAMTRGRGVGGVVEWEWRGGLGEGVAGAFVGYCGGGAVGREYGCFRGEL